MMNYERRHVSEHAEDETSSLPRWLSHAALLIALAAVAARAMTMEVLRDFLDPSPGTNPVPRGAGPASSMVLDAVMFLPALLVLLRGLCDRRFVVRFNMTHALMFAMAAWVGASTIWASDKFAAAVTASHWLAGVSVAWAVSQSVRDAARLRLVAGIAAGLLLVYVAHGAIYRFVDVPENRRNFEANKEEIFRNNGWSPDSFLAKQFERKVLSGDIVGLAASPNTYAAVIVMLGVVVAGAMLQRIADRDEWGFAATLAAAIALGAGALLLADSRTAYATPFLAAGLMFVLAQFGSALSARRKTVYGATILAVVLGTAFLISHGLRYGTLFHDSLNFRWKYWVGAFGVFREHLLLGVGWSNFGPFYLGHRLLDAPEEIKDPHNFFVRCFTELGIIGGILLIAWQARLWWDLSFTRKAPDDSDALAQDRAVFRSPLAAIALIAVVAMAINGAMSLDIDQNAGYVFIESLKRFLFGGLLVIGGAVAIVRSSTVQEFDDRPAPWIARALVVALAVFIVHNLIDFQLGEIGAMGVFMILLGAAQGTRGRESAAGGIAISLVPRGVAFGVATLLWLLFAFGIATPVILAESAAQAGDAYIRQSRLPDAAGAYRTAFDTLWIPNADYAYRSARAQIFGRGNPATIRQTLADAINADPSSATPRRTRAQFDLREPQPDVASVRADFEWLLKLNPNDVQTRLEYAKDVLERFNLRANAVEQYRSALRYNDGLSKEEPKRLTPAQIAEINSRIEALSATP